MIWCVEDDDSIRDIELYALNSVGIEAKGFANGLDFLDALKEALPELVILDIMLPGMDGVALLKIMKSQPKTAQIPIIMATAKGMEYDKVQSLDAGADDYLVKPFGMMEMVSRVKAILRRCKKDSVRQIMQLGTLLVNLEEHTVTIDGEPIDLTYKEFELLHIFITNPRKAFTRDALYDKVWGMSYVGETRTVDVHMRTLRHKLGRYGKLIETVRGVGYRFGEIS